MIENSGERKYFMLRQLCCENCKTIHIELPDIMFPHKHYSREAIENATDCERIHCCAEDSTINRWRKQHREVSDGIIKEKE